MKLIVDANIFIAALIKPDSIISAILLSKKFECISPSSMIDELNSNEEKYNKYKKKKKYKKTLINTIKFIPDEKIPRKTRKQAYGIVKEVDEDDAPYVALAIYEKSFIWTGDLKLHRYLNKNEIHFTITTTQLIKNFNRIIKKIKNVR